MYDKIFSPQWIFDLCLLGSYVGIYVLIAAGILFFIVSLKVYLGHWKAKKILRLFIAIIGAIATGFGGMVLVYIVFFLGGFFILSCSAATQFYPGIISGHRMHAMIKNSMRNSGQPPKNIEELKQLDIAVFNDMVANSKISYIYNNDANSYSLLVRPSRFFVAVYDTGLDFQLYRIIKFFSVFKFEFPDYPGQSGLSWNQIPK